MSFSAHQDKKLKIAHLINPFLPMTEGWIYNEIAHNTQCNSIVLCRYRMNERIFPLENVFSAHSKYDLIAKAHMLLARLRARYFNGAHLKTIAAEKPDILHGHFAFESWRNIDLVRKSGIPLVTTFYGLDIDKLSRRAAWKRRYPVLFEIGRLFIVEGPFMARRLEAIGCPPHKIRIVYQAADIERIRAHASAHDPGRINIMFVGLARLKKGAEYAAKAFIEAAKADSRTHLHLVGDGLYRKKTYDIFVRAGILSRVTYHGYIKTDTYMKLLGQADILLAPSITDPNGDTEGGAPVSVIDALAAGVPVVGTNHCDIPNIVIHGETGLLCGEGDDSALGRNLIRFVTDDRMRQEFCAAASASAMKRFSITQRTADLTRIYREVVA